MCWHTWDSSWNDRYYWRRQRHYHNIPWLFGLGAMFMLFRWFVPGVILFCVGIAKTLGWLADSAERSPPRVPTSASFLSMEEKNELDAIKAYAATLEKAGGDSALAKELISRANAIVAARVNVLQALRDLRASLPPLTVAERDSFASRLQKEVSLLNKTEGELPR